MRLRSLEPWPLASRTHRLPLVAGRSALLSTSLAPIRGRQFLHTRDLYDREWGRGGRDGALLR
jgi:hypothetical protein